jgi:hypothetical protein
MLWQTGQIISSFLFAFFCLKEDLPLPSRLMILSVLAGLFLLSRSFLRKSGTPSFFEGWIVSSHVSPVSICLAFSFCLCALFTFHYQPRSEISSVFSGENMEATVGLDLKTFEIHPLSFPASLIQSNFDSLRVSGFFYVSHPIHAMMFYSSHASATWKIDGEVRAQHEFDSPVRYLTFFDSLEPGYHEIEAEFDFLGFPIPAFSVSASPAGAATLRPLPGPFFLDLGVKNFFLYSLIENLSLFFVLLTLFFLLPAINGLLLRVLNFSSSVPGITYLFLFLIGLAVLFLARGPFLEHGLSLYEADEAAFGVMSQQLLQGQSPPFFHYGQKYQGTVEAFLLAPLLVFFSSPALALHVLPNLFFILFLLTSVYCCTRYGSPRFGLFSFYLLSLGGLHFHWIFSKAWFGYGFTLAGGSLLWWVVFDCYEKKYLRPFMGVLFGVVSGLCLYALPLSAPFVIFSVLCLLYSLSFNRKNIFSVCLGGVFLLLFLSPYYLSFLFNTGAVEFLSQGRELPSPRVLGERKLLDRFLGECLPTLLGTRAPFQLLEPVSSAWFARFPGVLFLVSLAVFPFFGARAFSKTVLAHRVLRGGIFFFSLFTILLVTYSPFGVWPWYAIPLYFSLPFLFYVLCFALWTVSPSLSALVAGMYVVSVGSSLLDASPLYHQPSSVTQQGVLIPTTFEDIKAELAANDIDAVICDQGVDYTPNDAGRDWLGECLTFDSSLSVLGSNRLLRRFPELAQETLYSTRVGYMFHESFVFNHPPAGAVDSFFPFSTTNLDRLFLDRLSYQKRSFPPYILYLPGDSSFPSDKPHWKIESSYPFFLGALHDHNISFRSYGRDAYWSSGEIREAGGWVKIHFPSQRLIQNLVLFHGTKKEDYPDQCAVSFLDGDNRKISLGFLSFDEIARCSFLSLDEPVHTRNLFLEVGSSAREHWWTVYEIWAF